MNDINSDNFRITGRESLASLLKKNTRTEYKRIIVAVEHMEETKARKFENKLNKYYTSCGCSTGNYFLVTALVLCIIYLYFTDQALNNWLIYAQVFAVLLIAAVGGKLIGKLVDGFKFKQTLNRLNQEFI